jgi:hypothetical protein
LVFSTGQITIAGDESVGLQYGAITTEEKYFLKWKEDEAVNSIGNAYHTSDELVGCCNLLTDSEPLPHSSFWPSPE